MLDAESSPQELLLPESTPYQFGTSSFQFTDPATTADKYYSPQTSQATQPTLSQPTPSQHVPRRRRKSSNKAGTKDREYKHCITRLLTDEGNSLPLEADDLEQLALSEFDNTLLIDFNNALDLDTMSIYDICNKRQFNMNLQTFTIETVEYTNVCSHCRSKTRKGSTKR